MAKGNYLWYGKKIDNFNNPHRSIYILLRKEGEKMAKKRNPNISDFLKKYYDNISENIDNEVWKPILLGDFPIYEISNLGRVRRLDNGFIINPFHSYRKDSNGKFLYERPTYLRVQLYYYENGIRYKKHMEISRLVAINFIPIPNEYKSLGLTEKDLEVNHIKGGYNIYDNSISNLEWCTQKENIHKAFETGLRHPPKGENHHSTFLNENDVIQICEFIEAGFNVKDTYDLISLSVDIPFKQFKPNYYNIKYKNSWKFISQNYNF